MAKKQEMFEGMPVIEAANNDALEKKLAKMAERPAKYVVRISNKATKIKEDAFRDNEEIAAVLIPDSVTEIGRTAFFGCKGLTRLEIPASVTRIGDFEIYGCDSFVDCNLQSIVVAKDNPVYDSRKNCNAIIEKKTNILRIASNKTVIPDSVTDIGWWAFSGRSEITSIIIPDSVKCIGRCAFSDCTALKSVEIGKSVIEIEENAFKKCTSLTSIVIPDSVTEIGPWAFGGCTGLTSINIPKSVTRLINSAFEGCSGLQSITVADDNPAYDSRQNCNAIIEKETNTLQSGCDNTVIPDSVEIIGFGAFSGCVGLQSIIIPNSVTKISPSAFIGCNLNNITVSEGNKVYDSRNNCNAIIEKETNTLITGCNNTIIPDSVTKIKEDAFRGRTGLTNIIIPDSVTEIESTAFQGCTGLTSIDIPNSVQIIKSWAFRNCI